MSKIEYLSEGEAQALKEHKRIDSTQTLRTPQRYFKAEDGLFSAEADADPMITGQFFSPQAPNGLAAILIEQREVEIKQSYNSQGQIEIRPGYVHKTVTEKKSYCNVLIREWDDRAKRFGWTETGAVHVSALLQSPDFRYRKAIYVPLKKPVALSEWNPTPFPQVTIG